MSMTVGVIGLGSMGFGMATSLLNAGHVTYGFDVVVEQQNRFVELGGAQGTLNEVAASVQALVIVVLNAEQTQNVLFGRDGIASQLVPGTVVVASATVSPEFAADMERRCSAIGLLYLDAPVSGGAANAAKGALSFMASGSEEAFKAAKPVLDATSETVFRLGNSAGQGSAMKAVNQMLAGTHIAMMTEALTFGMTQGIEPKTFVDVISRCAGTSWMLENRAPHIVAGDYKPRSSVNIWPKDLGIALDIAKSAQFSAPITAVALQQFIAAAGMGHGDEDDAAVAKVYARNAGLTLPGQG